MILFTFFFLFFFYFTQVVLALFETGRRRR